MFLYIKLYFLIIIKFIFKNKLIYVMYFLELYWDVLKYYEINLNLFRVFFKYNKIRFNILY